MPHIHDQPGQHDHVVTAYIIRTDFDEPKALLHMHRKIGKLLAIGGHIELDENPWQAVTHELREESGYDIADLKVLQPVDRVASLTGATVHPQPVVVNTHNYPGSTHFHTDSAYAFVADGEPAHDQEDGESDDVRWLSQEELRTLHAEGEIGYVFEVYNHIFNICLKTWQAVDSAEFKL